MRKEELEIFYDLCRAIKTSFDEPEFCKYIDSCKILEVIEDKIKNLERN